MRETVTREELAPVVNEAVSDLVRWMCGEDIESIAQCSFFDPFRRRAYMWDVWITPRYVSRLSDDPIDFDEGAQERDAQRETCCGGEELTLGS